MRNLENFYVKNTLDDQQVYLRLSPVVFPENDFTYDALKVINEEGNNQIVEQKLTYGDIMKMYEDGFYTIEKQEFEIAKALVCLQVEKTEG